MASSDASSSGPVPGLTPKTLAIGVALSVGCAYWVRHAEFLVFTCEFTMAVPPLTAFACLVLLVVLRRLTRAAAGVGLLTDAEIAVVYLFVTVATLMAGVGVMQAFLPYLTLPFYLADAENELGQIAGTLPSWLGPRDPEVIRTYYEGVEAGGVPWRAWVGPLLIWGGFFVAFWWTALCLWAIFRKQWVDRERLTFPIVSIASLLLRDERRTGSKGLLANPLTWVGFSLSLGYHVLNIAHVVNPGVAAPGISTDVGLLFTERPLNAIGWLQIFHRPELIGLGYLVPLDILLSTWVFWVLQLVAAVLGASAGVQKPGFPFFLEQGLGAYVGVGLFILYTARGHLKGVLRRACALGGADDTGEPLRYPVAVWGGLAGFLSLAGFAMAVGVKWWVALGFFAMIFLFLLTYGRIRAESGVPSVWVLPHSELKFMPVWLLGSAALDRGSGRGLTALTSFFWLVHGGFYSQSTVFQLEGFKLADEVGLKPRKMVTPGLLAVAIGLAIAFPLFLTTNYEYGSNVLGGGHRWLGGGVRVLFATDSWTELSRYVQNPASPDPARRAAMAVGLIVSAGLLITKSALLRAPLNPIGYVLATANGVQLWWSFLLAWIAKSAILKVGGVGLYRRLVPCFLGIALGHFFIGGVVWGTLAMFFPEIDYTIWFA